MDDNDPRQFVRNGEGFDEKWRCLHEGKHLFIRNVYYLKHGRKRLKERKQ